VAGKQNAGGKGKEHYLARCVALLGTRPFLAAAVHTTAINALALTGPAYMLVLFDRVLPARSGAELLAASLLMLVLYALGARVDLARQRVIAGCAHRVERSLGALAARRLPAIPGRELATIRAFLGSQTPAALCDLPWVPLYLFVLLLLHPLFCALALTGAGAVGASVVLIERFAARDKRRDDKHQAAIERNMLMAVVLRALRPALQSAILGLGAYLVMTGACGSASALAAAIVLPRLIGPVEVILVHGRGLAEAHMAAQRLATLLAAPPPRASGRSRVACEPGRLRIVLRSSRSYARSARRGTAMSLSSALRPTAQ